MFNIRVLCSSKDEYYKTLHYYSNNGFEIIKEDKDNLILDMICRIDEMEGKKNAEDSMDV